MKIFHSDDFFFVLIPGDGGEKWSADSSTLLRRGDTYIASDQNFLLGEIKLSVYEDPPSGRFSDIIHPTCLLFIFSLCPVV